MTYKDFKEKAEFFDCIKINSINELNDFIQKQKDNQPEEKELKIGDKTISSKDLFAKRSSDFTYRGIKESKFPLKTSLQVHWDEIKRFHPEVNPLEYLESIVEMLRENEAIQEYQNSKEVRYTDIGYLALMQHYGIPTPLLDWTHSIETALNFCHDGIVSHKDDEISNYVSLYYIDLHKNREFAETTLQNILNNACYDTSKIVKNYDASNVDMSNCSIGKLFSCQDLGWDFIYIDHSRNAKNVIDIFGNVFSLINPNLEIQDGAFVINFGTNDSLEVRWYKKLSDDKKITIKENDKNICDISVKITTEELPNKSGILPQTKISCVDIRKDVLCEWYNYGGAKTHYDNTPESRELKKEVLGTYYRWILDSAQNAPNLIEEYKTIFVGNKDNEDKIIANYILEEYCKRHS